MPTIKLVKSRKLMTANIRANSKQYNSKRWKRMREVMMRDFPVCEMCLQEGRTTPSQLVHHKRPWQFGRTDTEQEELMFDYDNLQCLCNECHSKVHHGMNIAAAYERVKR